ncbi:MAG TPA: hypothetical protein VJN68_00370 [Burkholderiaceae bacterium]|nr:hypothetical protein [Burkholderiaceae bacterium]
MRIDVVKSLSLACTLIGLVAAVPAFAADPTDTYKCPGRIYSNTMSAKEAKDKGCTVLEGSVTVIQGTKPRPVSSASASSPPGSKIDPADQRARDSDARQILEAELRREEERLSALQKEFNGGEPERRGDEKNYQKYQDRTADLKAQIDRKTSDIAAIKRELAKLPQ